MQIDGGDFGLEDECEAGGQGLKPGDAFAESMARLKPCRCYRAGRNGCDVRRACAGI